MIRRHCKDRRLSVHAAFHADAGPHIVPQFTHPLVPALDGRVQRRMAEIWHPHLVLWGEKDGWIAPADLKTMAAAIPCRLITVPGIGHSMNLEPPALYPGYFGAWLGGLPGSEVAI
jgi:pimeloyl-ACP methyl ester carboxylesterase